MKIIQEEIHKIRIQNVVIVTDANAWIGDRPSIITREIEVEDGVEEGSTIYHRRMVKSDVNRERRNEIFKKDECC